METQEELDKLKDALKMLIEKNKTSPSKKNSVAITHIETAILWLENY